MRWRAWQVGRQTREAIISKWLAPFCAPLMAAVTVGPAMGIAFIGYNLLYNVTVVRTSADSAFLVTASDTPIHVQFVNKDDRMADLPEDAHLGAAFQEHGLRQWLRRHYYTSGPDSFQPHVLPFMTKLMTTPKDDASSTAGTQAGIPPHQHTVAGMSMDAWRAFQAISGRRHWRIFRQPNVDPEDSLVRDTRPLMEQILHRGSPKEHRHLHDPALIYHPKTVPAE